MSNELGELITKWRELRRMSQTDLHSIASLSSPSIVNRTEKGDTLPTVDNIRSIAKALGAESQIMAAYERALLEKKPRERAAVYRMDMIMAVPADWRAAPLILLNHASLHVAPTAELLSSNGFASQDLGSAQPAGLPTARESSFQEVECVGWVESWNRRDDRPVQLRNAIRIATLLCIAHASSRFGLLSTPGGGEPQTEAAAISALSLFLPAKANLDQRRPLLAEIMSGLEENVQRLNTWHDQELAWKQKAEIQLSVRLDMPFGSQPPAFRGSNQREEDPMDQSQRRVSYHLENFRPRWELLLDVIWLEMLNQPKGRQ